MNITDFRQEIPISFSRENENFNVIPFNLMSCLVLDHQLNIYYALPYLLLL